jgi:methylmalonyl-CoA mutase N-terminal domain/subunit
MPEVLEVGEETERKQIESLRKLKQERDSKQVSEALENVLEVAMDSENIMPAVIDAVKAYATVGEVSDALRKAFGEYREPNIL